VVLSRFCPNPGYGKGQSNRWFFQVNWVVAKQHSGDGIV